MSGSLRAVRLGLEAQLATLDIRAHDVWPSTINPPAAIVRPLSGSFGDTFDADVTYQLEVVVLLQLGRLETAQEQVDAYIATDGPKSIRAAIEADQKLGGSADSVVVRGWREFGSMVVGAAPDGTGPEYIGVKFDVEVMT